MDGAWLCGRAEEGQRPVTAHGCSGCPLWQPCAATGRWHDCMIGTSGPRAPGECSLKAWVLTKNTVPKTKTLAFSLNSVGKIRPRRTRACLFGQSRDSARACFSELFLWSETRVASVSRDEVVCQRPRFCSFFLRVTSSSSSSSTSSSSSSSRPLVIVVVVVVVGQ